MKLCAYYINLDRSPDKRRQMDAQLRGAPFPHTRISAVDARDLSDSDLRRLTRPGFIEQHGHYYKSGAIACALSHVSALKQMLIDGADVALILEDDILIPESSHQVILEAAKHVNETSVFLVYFHGDTKRFLSRGAVKVDEKHAWHRAKSAWGAYSAAGYLVGRNVAERLIEHNSLVHKPADSWGTFKRDGLIDDLWALLPLPTKPAAFLSDIGYGRFSAAKRTLSRMPGARHLLGYARAKLRPIPVSYDIVDEEPDAI